MDFERNVYFITGQQFENILSSDVDELLVFGFDYVVGVFVEVDCCGLLHHDFIIRNGYSQLCFPPKSFRYLQRS